MLKIYTLFFALCICSNAYAQKVDLENKSDEIINYTIVNNETIITNEMLFSGDYCYEKNRNPLILVNGNKVNCISYYNKEEIKSIVVLQPKEAIKKYKNKGINGVILVTLKESVLEPKIKILTNKIYYKCKNENNIEDTSKILFDKLKGENCKTLNLTDTAKTQSLYIGFDNVISIKNLGAGWDKTIITMSGGSMSGSNNERIIRVTKKGIAIITIGRGISNKNISTVIKLYIKELPGWK